MKLLEKYKYILFDAANTLIHKPSVWEKMFAVLEKHEITIAIDKLRYNHKLLSEIIDFPDRTSFEFYRGFNQQLILSLGIIPTDELLDELFSACKGLPWEKFDDTESLKEINIPMGVLSNFNKDLPQLVQQIFGDIFSDIISSEQLQLRKPSQEFYERAVAMTGFQKDEILYVGDSLKLDIIPANKIGVAALLIDRPGFFGPNNTTITDLYALTR